MAHLTSMVPRNISVVYTYPDFFGCNLIEIPKTLFPNLDIVVTDTYASPIKGFLDAQQKVRTKYVLLMHNDCYMMDTFALCELYKV